METWSSYGITGNTTGTNREDEASRFHDDCTSNVRYRDRCSSNVSESEERRPDETIQEYLGRMDPESDLAENVNGNHYVGSSRSTYRSGSELTSDSSYMDGERRDSNHSEADVFLPSQPNGSEQRKILEQKMRELRGSQRSWKRVADYVNGLPIIPEPSHGDEKNENMVQAKRQRIWSEGRGRSRAFADSGSRSFAGGMGASRRRYTTSSSECTMSQRFISPVQNGHDVN